MNNKHDIWKRYNNLLAKNLRVKPCKIKFGLDDGKHLGMFDGSYIHLKNDDITIDNLFTFAHEFYHYYQSIKYSNFDELMKTYEDVGGENYANQQLEKEAYGFQELVMHDVFGIKVQYKKPLITCNIPEKITIKDDELKKIVLFILRGTDDRSTK